MNRYHSFVMEITRLTFWIILISLSLTSSLESNLDLPLKIVANTQGQTLNSRNECRRPMQVPRGRQTIKCRKI